MRKIVLGLAVSLDGFIEGPNGEFDWCFTDQDYGLTEFFGRIDALFMGRKSYELAQQLGDAAAIPGMPQVQEYIFSDTLNTVKPGAILVRREDSIEQIRQIKSGPGKDIWLYGGAELTSFLVNEGLLDELWLSVHPILLGAGKPLFEGLKDRVELKLTETKTYETGLVSLKYELVSSKK